MELQELRQKLSEAGFSEEVRIKLDAILEKAIANGSLSEEDRAQMTELMDIDIEAGNLEADVMENMAVMLDSYVNETENITKLSDAEEEKIYADADKEADNLDEEMAELQRDDMPAEEVAPVVPAWNQPVIQEPVAPVEPVVEVPVTEAPVVETPVVPQWSQNVSDQPAPAAPAPFPGSQDGQE